MTQPRCRRPTDPLVPASQKERGWSKTQGSQPTMITADQITQLRANQGRVPAGMLLDHQIIPQPVEGILFIGDQMQVQVFDLAYLTRNIVDRWQCLSRRSQPMTVGLTLGP